MYSTFGNDHVALKVELRGRFIVSDNQFYKPPYEPDLVSEQQNRVVNQDRYR